MLKFIKNFIKVFLFASAVMGSIILSITLMMSFVLWELPGLLPFYVYATGFRVFLFVVLIMTVIKTVTEYE